jgi:segregation and condensation protein A
MPVENEYSDILKFKLENFEGPLDLLLYLIQKHKMNITDIPISALLEQYMEFINAYAADHSEVAAEFLEMAAKLLYIKTASLLPKAQAAEVMKKELQGRLIEYALIKQLSQRLKTVFMGDTYTVRKPLKLHFDATYALVHDKRILAEATENLRMIKQTDTPKLDPFAEIVTNKVFSVNQKIVDILKILYRTGVCVLRQMFEDLKDKSERVAAFLAVLEMTKSGRIRLSEDNSQIVFNR